MPFVYNYFTDFSLQFKASSSSSQLFLFLGPTEPQLLADPWPRLSRRGDNSFLLPPVAPPMPSSINVQNFHGTSTSVRKLAIGLMAGNPGLQFREHGQFAVSYG